MGNTIKLTLLLSGIVTLSGCGSSDNDLEAMKTKPTAYVLIENADEDKETPLNYVIVPKAESISVLYDFEEDYEDFTLNDYEVTAKEVTLNFNEQEVTLTDIDDQQYEDESGNVYELSIITDEE